MKCAVLGGAGFIGSHLTRALVARGHTPRIFDRPDLKRLRRDYPHAGEIEWQEGDFTNAANLARAVDGCEAVYHLVSTTLPKTATDNPVYDVETNIVGSLRMLEAARTAGVRRVVFVSSGGTVYGIPRTLPVAETHPTDPITAYGISKLAVEKYLHLYSVLHGLDYVILRISNPYGERQRIASAQGAVTTFLQRALEGQPIEIWGDGSVVRDYLYVGDAAEALAAALEYTGAEKVFNIGSGEGRSLNQVADAVEALTGARAPRHYLAARKFDVPVSVLDITRARVKLGWSPCTAFEEGLRRTADWLRRDATAT